MVSDQTENVRRILTYVVNENATVRETLEAEYRKGNVWTTEELRRDFEVLAFAAPYVVVKRRTDNVNGSIMFQHAPRLYFDFQPE